MPEREAGWDENDKLNDKSISAALLIVDFLIANCNEIGIFRYPGRADLRTKLLDRMEQGDEEGLKKLLRPGIEIECSAALSSYLENLAPPLIPLRVEKLVTGKNDVPYHIVAIDALGLLQDELTGNYLKLSKKIFELLYKVSKTSRRTELSTISVAVNLLPVFFHIKGLWADQWQRVSLIFHEMIIISQENEMRNQVN